MNHVELKAYWAFFSYFSGIYFFFTKYLFLLIGHYEFPPVLSLFLLEIVKEVNLIPAFSSSFLTSSTHFMVISNHIKYVNIFLVNWFFLFSLDVCRIYTFVFTLSAIFLEQFETYLMKNKLNVDIITNHSNFRTYNSRGLLLEKYIS